MDGEAVLAWYAARSRAYPWRRTRDPYRIWVSEVMLQQTQVSRVVPAYHRFVGRFPTLRTLAAAPLADVIAAWDGLGYNRRAVALARAAEEMVRTHGGRLPRDPAALRALPGIGPYTAAAVASIAFGLPVPAVDTNVRRVVARVAFGTDPHAVRAEEIDAEARRWLAGRDPSSWNQALMDLGRERCRPRPRCAGCPMERTCRFLADGVRPGPGAGRRQPPFEGSSRHVRGAVVGALRRRSPMPLGELARISGFPLERVAGAVAALRADGLVSAGPAALRGSGRGWVRLAG
ncbi:MAG: A/G-specific adenine glycosylase [Candidatus Velamenicoccus archaeovorus]